MATSKKRLDLRFGAFACSVQGFDDPVMPVQQILRAIQHLLEESPEIADAGISFDAETVESLIEEVSRRAEVNMSDLEIAPGLVIIYHGEGNAPAIDAKAAGAAAGGAGDSDDGPSDDEDAGEAPGDGNVSDLFTARLRRSLGDDADEAETVIEGASVTAEEGPDAGGEAAAQDIFAPPSESGGGIFHDPMAEAEETPAASDGKTEPPSADDGEAPETFEPSGVNLFGNYLAGGGAAGASDAEDAGEDDAAEKADDAEAADEPALELGPEMEVSGGADDPHSVAGIAKLAGAETVADMVVSAAAWMVLLKGQTTFSRRDVLDAFDQIPGDHPKTLEARIKGFGKAVRNRQIVMVKDGTFRMSSREIERFQNLL